MPCALPLLLVRNAGRPTATFAHEFDPLAVSPACWNSLPDPDPTPSYPTPPTHHYLHLAACSYLNQGKLDPNGVELADVQNIMGELIRSNQI